MRSCIVCIIKVGVYKKFRRWFLGCLDDMVKKEIGKDNRSHWIAKQWEKCFSYRHKEAFEELSKIISQQENAEQYLSLSANKEFSEFSPTKSN